VCWSAVVLTSTQPPFSFPLVRCAPGCPPNALFVGLSNAYAPALWIIIRMAWIALAVGVPLLLVKRVRFASGPVRRCLAPVMLLALLYALATVAFLVLAGAAPSSSAPLASVLVGLAPAIPLVMLLGLAWESLYMGNALAAFVNRLAEASASDVQALMSEALADPYLRIAFRGAAGEGDYLDAFGASVSMAHSAQHLSATPIERAGHPVAFVLHDLELSDQGRCIEAAGAAAVMSLEKAQLIANLNATIGELAASRARLVDAADAERQRIEQSLHDGAQQRLLGVRLRLEIAADAIRNDPARGLTLLAEIGRQMDETLEEVRNLAKGVYPPLLAEHGLAQALRSATRSSPWPASVEDEHIGRYPADVETAVYFCCLEALQNTLKHAGSTVTSAIRLWEDSSGLCFEIRDDGAGFDAEIASPGNGLINMRDRMEAAGGTLTVNSSTGHGTVVRGKVPHVYHLGAPTAL
jgi:signal transduction histidine kinase